jgi:predicted CXXCH cytochrome family protein
MIEALDGSVGMAALMGGHGFLTANLAVATKGLEGPANLAQSGLVGNGNATFLDCTACHDPHAAENPPFLRAPLEQLCQKCHSGSDQQGLRRWTLIEDSGVNNGSHTVLVPYGDSGIDNSGLTVAGKSFRQPDPLFDQLTRTRLELTSPTLHWEMGGHLTGPERMVSCPTCHSAHLPRENQLVHLVSEDPVMAECSGCHGTEEKPQSPGVSEFYHPTGEEALPPYRTTTTPGFELAIQIPPEYPVGELGQLLCITCHAVHQGWEGQKAIRNPVVESSYICESCHFPDPDILEENSHHITMYLDFMSTSPYRYENPSWWDGMPGTAGDLSDGLTCTDCHTGLAKNAHNW